MAVGFLQWGFVSSGGSMVVSAAAGECAMISPGSLFGTGLMIGHSSVYNAGDVNGSFSSQVGGKGALIPVGNGAPVILAGEVPAFGHSATRQLNVRNYTAGALPFAVSGDVTTFAAEGIDDVFTIFANALGNNSYDGLVPQAGYAYLITFAGAYNNAVGWKVTIGATDVLTIPTGLQRWWLWPDSGAKIRWQTGGSVGIPYDGALRVTRYAVGNLPEYTQRLVINQAIAAGGTYNLRPPVGERWYIDVHSMQASEMWYNGTTQMSGLSATPTSLVLSNDSWIQYRPSTAKTLFVTGTKEVV